MLDAQPGLAAAVARQNQGLTPAEAKIAAAAIEDVRLQKKMMAELQQVNTQLAADRVQLREQLAVGRQLAAATARRN